jgi:hypothetical protein
LFYLLPWYYIWKSKSAFARTDGQEPRFICWNKAKSYCMRNLVTQILHTILYFQMHIEPLLPRLKMQEKKDGFHKNHNELSQTKINSSSSTLQESHKFSMPILKVCGPCGSASQASIWNISAQSQISNRSYSEAQTARLIRFYLIRILKSPLPPITSSLHCLSFLSLKSQVILTGQTSSRWGGEGTYRYTLGKTLLCNHFPFPSGALIASGQHNDDEGKVIVH